MTFQEAEKYFDLPDNWDFEDLKDSKEELLFEQKTFFLSKTPLLKLFASRLKKISTLNDALTVLGLISDVNFKPFVLNFSNTDSILDSFQEYHAEKLKLKSRIINCENPLEINHLVLTLIELEKKYASNWFLDNSWDEFTLVTKEIDPMEMLTAIRRYDKLGGKNFQDLVNKKNNPPEQVLSEMKRLSLLFKTY
ncbi:MAG: hypothetical protein V4622_11710 [Bacteroidota bacterium]